MRIEWLGRIDYQTGLQIQNKKLESCLSDGAETVILLEHEPVYTIGRLPDKSSLRNVVSSHIRYSKSTGAARPPTMDPASWSVIRFLIYAFAGGISITTCGNWNVS
jgi:hypothetical protein